MTKDTSSSEELNPKFLDKIENGYASEDNPHRIGIFIRKGRLFESSNWEGGDADSISKRALEMRRAAIATTLTRPNKRRGQTDEQDTR